MKDQTQTQQLTYCENTRNEKKSKHGSKIRNTTRYSNLLAVRTQGMKRG